MWARVAGTIMLTPGPWIGVIAVVGWVSRRALDIARRDDIVSR